MDWKQKISGCFGNENQVFSTNRDSAFELLVYLRSHRIGWSVVQPEFRRHLESHGCGPRHTAQQIVKIRNHMRPWLNH
jgi:hypothetical protein